MAARSVSKSAASTGNSPQNTTGTAGRKPGSGVSTGWRSSVMVSPTRVSATSLMDAVDLVGRLGPHEPDALMDPQAAVDDTDEDDDAEIGIIPGIDQQRFKWRVKVALRRGQPANDRLEHGGDIKPGFGGNLDCLRGVKPDHVFDLLLDLRGLGGRQIDLVEDRHDLVIVVDRLIDVGERLRF